MEDRELEKIKNRMMEKIMKSSQSFWINGEVLELSSSNFSDAILKTNKPILVDFWANWCGPCRIMKPVIKSMAKEYSGQVYFAKVDVDRNQTLANKYGVMSIPNFVIFKNGKPVDRIIGAVGKSGLERALKKYLM